MHYASLPYCVNIISSRLGSFSPKNHNFYPTSKYWMTFSYLRVSYQCDLILTKQQLCRSQTIYHLYYNHCTNPNYLHNNHCINQSICTANEVRIPYSHARKYHYSKSLKQDFHEASETFGGVHSLSSCSSWSLIKVTQTGLPARIVLEYLITSF
jgi:hypothetical protein